MAGIGFLLPKVGPEASLLRTAGAVGHGAVVAAGPWMFCTLAIALIHRGTIASTPITVSLDFRGLVIYAFAISLLATAPIVNVAMRVVADDIYRREFEKIRPRFLSAVIASGIASALVSFVVFGMVFRLGAQLLVAATISTVIIGLIWPTLAFCGAIRDFRGITAGFIAGLLLSVLGTIWIALHGWSAPGMLVSFVFGLLVILFWLAGRVLAAFPYPVHGMVDHLSDLAGRLRDYWVLGLGSFAAMAAIWADKWVLWFSPIGVLLPNGLVSAPDYDGAMFIAYLTIIPALGLFVASVEPEIYGACRKFLAAIKDRAPLDHVEQLADEMSHQTFRFVYRMLVTQLTVCVAAILAAHWIVPVVGLQFQQLGILRLGLLATFFQFMFLVCSSVLMFFDRHVRFLLLQALFLATQIGLTWGSLMLGAEYLGFGHLLACAISGVASVLVLERTLTGVSYLTFQNALRQQPVARPAVQAAPAATPAAAPAAVPEPAVRPVRTPSMRPTSAMPKPLLRP